MSLPRLRDTIFAPSSGQGRSAVSVIRISGPGCAVAWDRLATGPAPAERVATLRVLRDPESREVLDQALVLRFARPRSFTGEDMLELQVTGGRAVLTGVLAALAKLPGLRPAEPGEFAWRAFENSKLDLSEVEGLADLVEAETAAQRRQALRIAGGALSREADDIRALVLEAMATLEVQLDFSDVDAADEITLAATHRAIAAALARIEIQMAGAKVAERVREGLNVVIAGPPNVGKSTLLNALAKREVAIVSATPGTTRDVIEVAMDLGGLPITLIDTAGLRETEDPIEREGIARARRRAEAADLTLWLTDATRPESPPPPGLNPVLTVMTKSDLVARGAASGALSVCALSGEGVPQLLSALEHFAREALDESRPALLSSPRQRIAFEDAHSALMRARSASADSPELLAEDLRFAARALERIAGRIDVEDILGSIFSRLCVGK